MQAWMTQELIANMLGVRRQGVAEAAHELQNVGLIRNARGSISVLDRKGLEKRTDPAHEPPVIGRGQMSVSD